MENKIKHLEMIEKIITRMGTNSFMLKGWAVTLIAGIFALSSKNTDKIYFLVAYIPIIVFWGLDSFYLSQERSFRMLYDSVRNKKENEIDFSMKPIIADLSSKKKCGWIDCFLSKTEMGFYFPLAMVCAGIMLLQLLG